MNNKFLIGIGAAFVLVFAGGIAAVVGITSMTDHVTVSEYQTVAKTPEVVVPSEPKPTFARFSPEVEPPAEQSGVAAATTTPVPVAVNDADLLQLADSIQLGSPSSGRVGKEVWRRQIPVAQKLLRGMCDCDQRNWLKHFVETGQDAVSDSAHFGESIQLLASLRRKNQSLTQSAAPR